MPNSSINKKNLSGDTMPKNSQKSRKRKRTFSTDEEESELDSESASTIEKKLRSVATMKSLSQAEMRKLIKKLVANDHVLDFITLKAKDEISREKDEAEEIQIAAVIVNDPSIPKLTRAKARELNKPPLIALPSLKEQQTSEIATLIQEDLHSDEEDEEYTFKEDDFISDEDPNLTASDVDSQPRTPMTPFQEAESPQKFSADGVFKVPREMEVESTGDEIIATRTRSKFCLQQTTIEDLQSEFVPPDVIFDVTDTELHPNDEDWMEFLNTFSKPLNNSFVADDDDPVNDPEYVAADKIPFDAEELRDVNISKKELTDLVAELFEGLLNEGVCMESIDLETPKKDTELNKLDSPKNHVTENAMKEPIQESDSQNNPHTEVSLSSSNVQQNEFTFHPELSSTPQVQTKSRALNNELFVETTNNLPPCPNNVLQNWDIPTFEVSYADPYTTANRVIYMPNTYSSKIDLEVGNESQWCRERYIAAKKLLKFEYVNKFERLKQKKVEENGLSDEPTGFTQTQFQILQQQLRIHVQFLAQNFFQTYSHPDLWKIAPQQKKMLLELEEKSKEYSTFDVWNLKPALALVHEWEKELESDSEENSRLMEFIFRELRRVSKTHNQVSRFSPRIMKRILSSPVFMYPQYLPRIPFSANQISYHTFAPAEATLIAMGLEKHLNDILTHGQHFQCMKRRSPLSIACERMANSIIHGKTPRRIRDHTNELRKSSTYNPVKYYYEHMKAPPAEHKLPSIDFARVLPPEHQPSKLPMVWKDFLQVLNAGGIINNTYPDNYSQYVRELNGEKVAFSTSRSSVFRPKSRANRSSKLNKQSTKENEKPSVTININYLFGQAPNNLPGFNESNSTITFGFNESRPVALSPSKNTAKESPNHSVGKTNLTECLHDQPGNGNSSKKIPKKLWKPSFCLNKYTRSYFGKKLQVAAKKFRLAKNLQRRYENLLSAYRLNLEKQFGKYKNLGLRFLFRNFKSLDLYTNLLRDLRMNCKKAMEGDDVAFKRKMLEELDVPKSRKAYRQEENLRHMLLPDSAEDSNRKDAIYAFNFYEKVEEVLKQSNQTEDCKKFNYILRSFDSKKDKVADLYYRLEKLFLPNHPELAHVFLTFLLPSEAADIGKFFEHFMYTNAGTFFNKLHVYFNKQPAQIRKIYNCINELSDETDVTVEKMKSKIFPLLKGNPFLIDWFTQLFSSESPPERLLGSAETTNMKEVLTNLTGEYVESLHPQDVMDSPNESQHCQLKYINGRIFYGTKIPLPAKLSFMATSYQAEDLNEFLDDDKQTHTNWECVHSIREYGEQRLLSSVKNCSGDDNEKPLEETSNSQVIAEKETEQFDPCDDSTLHAHAVRLNPSFYSASCYSSTQTNAPSSCNRPVKLTPTAEEGKGSPRKAVSKVNPLTFAPCAVSVLKERRKSPKKSFVKSPSTACKRHLTDNIGQSIAIATARKLKNLIEEEPNYEVENIQNKFIKKHKDSDKKPHDELEDSEGELELTPKEEIKDEPMQPWTRDEDKIILEEIRSRVKDQNVYERINSKMVNRTIPEIKERYIFLMDFLSKYGKRFEPIFSQTEKNTIS